MTFTINATVTEVVPDELDKRNTAVILRAFAGDTVEGFGGNTMQAIYSNTEGKILGAQITLVIEGDEPPLAVGNVVPFTGHFTAPYNPNPRPDQPKTKPEPVA
jgi:hypothetical protein